MLAINFKKIFLRLFGPRLLYKFQSPYWQDLLLWLLLSTSGLDNISGPFKKFLTVSVQTQMVKIVEHKRIEEISIWKPRVVFHGIWQASCLYPPSISFQSLSFPTCKKRRFLICIEKLLGGMERMFLSGSANSKSLTSTSFK